MRRTDFIRSIHCFARYLMKRSADRGCAEESIELATVCVIVYSLFDLMIALKARFTVLDF